jgi:hypothetical protein
MSVTKLTKSELESTIRLLYIKDYIKLPEVRSHLTEDEFDLAKSHRFKISILERFFSLSDARTAWGVKYDGFNVKIISNKQSFYKAFAALIVDSSSLFVNFVTDISLLILPSCFLYKPSTHLFCCSLDHFL